MTRRTVRAPGPASRPLARSVTWIVPAGLLALAPATASAQSQAPEYGTARQESADPVRRLSLDEAVEIATRRSPSLEQAQANVRTAQTQHTGALGSFLPSVSLGYGFNKASTGRLDPTGQSITTTSYTGQLTGSLDLFDGFSRINELKSARKTVRARQATYDQQRFQAILDVKTAFFNAVAARERVEVERARVDRQVEQLDFTRQQLRLGRATRSDTLRSRVDLNDARLALLNARNDQRESEFLLAETMGVRERVAPAEEATLQPDSLRWDRDQLMRIAVRSSPGVRSAERSLEAAEASVSTARSSYFPSFQVSGGFDWRNDAFPPKEGSWSVRVFGSVPIFNGLQRETSISRARAQADAAAAEVRAAELGVRTDVQNAYDQIETALAGLRLARESVTASREDLRVSQQRFRLGMATTLDLRSAQIALEQAQVDVIRRQFDFQVGVAQLESLLGTDLDRLADGSGESRGGLSGASGSRVTGSGPGDRSPTPMAGGGV